MNLFLHGSCNNIKDAREAGRHKRCFTPFKSVCPFLLFAQKKWTKEKGTAARGLSGEFLAPALPDAAVARVESDFVGLFNGYYLSFMFC